jgi:hypothetical protein
LAELIDRIAKRVKSGITTPTGSPYIIAPPATLASIANDEQTLGFALPPLLKQLYLTIGNGGWGPFYGLLGLTGGEDEDERTAVSEYMARRGSTLSDISSDPNWWPEGMLPICDWGCAIFSCIDCSKSEFPMMVFDPDRHQTDGDWSDDFFSEGVTFGGWIELWVEGHDLWQRLMRLSPHSGRTD